MTMQPKEKTEVFAKRHISVPPDLDEIIENDAWENRDTYSGTIVKGMRSYYSKDNTQNDLQETQGKKNGR